MRPLPPLRRQVVVPAGTQVAFDVFTRHIGDWWPMDPHSVHGAGGTTTFRDGRLVEIAADGAEAVWGTVLDWDPPRRLRLTWHPGRDAASASEVEVGFTPVTDALTMVTLEHRGWERHADPSGAREEYGKGWPKVLSGYAAAVPAGIPADAGPVWLVLAHTPGPGVTNPFEHPAFPGHPAFLARLRSRGVLVAAGPFPGTGEGMTILRLDDPASVAETVRSAYEDDGGVTGGALDLRVRPWGVMTAGFSLA